MYRKRRAAPQGRTGRPRSLHRDAPTHPVVRTAHYWMK